MDFALNSVPAGAAAQLLPVKEVGSGLTSWLLVDAALLDRRQLAWAVAASGLHTVSTLRGSRLEAFGDSAPHMIAMLGDPLAVSRGLERLVAIDRTAPAFSAFASSSSVDELQRLFRYLGDARIDDDLDVYCRFADTRVLPSLLAVQTLKQAEHIGRSISVWKWFSRCEDVDQWVCPGPSPQPDLGDRIQLSAAQFDALLNASEADALFTMLLDGTPELVPQAQRGNFHKRLCLFINTAATYRVTAARDQLQFAVLSLTCGESFHLNPHPELVETWAGIRKHGTALTDAMKPWSDALWAALEHQPATAR